MKDYKHQEYKISGPVNLNLAKDYKPGEKGNPTVKEIENALRKELSDFLQPNHPINIRPHPENK